MPNTTSSPSSTLTKTRPTVLITGCTPGGIGHSLAIAFAQRDHVVFATARPSSLSQLSSLQSRFPDLIIPTALDVTSEESIQALVSTLKSHPLTTQNNTIAPKLDYLVHNAGVNYTVPALDIDIADLHNLFSTNLYSVIRITQLLSPLLIASHGTIVMMGSLGAVMPYVFGSAYNASKAALHAYANTLRVEMAPLGVTVITVVAGGVKSNLARTHRSLPEGSVYKAIEEEYERRQKYSQEVGTDNGVFAESVVGQVVKGCGDWYWKLICRDARRRWVWAGSGSSKVWLLAGGWTWSGLFDLYFSRLFALWKVGREVNRKDE